MTIVAKHALAKRDQAYPPYPFEPRKIKAAALGALSLERKALHCIGKSFQQGKVKASAHMCLPSTPAGLPLMAKTASTQKQGNNGQKKKI